MKTQLQKFAAAVQTMRTAQRQFFDAPADSRKEYLPACLAAEAVVDKMLRFLEKHSQQSALFDPDRTTEDPVPYNPRR